MLPLLSFCALVLTSQAAPAPPSGKITIQSVKLSEENVPIFFKVEATVTLQASFTNPFDPEDIRLYADFVSPKGRKVRVEGYYNQDYRRTLENGTEKFLVRGKPNWKLRFCPEEAGKWHYTVHARDRSGTVTTPEEDFICRESSRPGFVRRSRTTPGFFAFDNGFPYVAIGLNVGWGGKRGSFDYNDWLNPLANANANWIRVWMSAWNGALEWSRESKGDWRSGDYQGVGRYALDNAYKIDEILSMCEKRGIYVMLCFGTYGEFTDGGFFNEGQWKGNPYNVANGGPCQKPAEFWTNETARKLYRQRLRYIFARYASLNVIHSWEFWNELLAPSAWVAEMARYVKGTGEFEKDGSADPYRHLLAHTYGNDAIWKLPEIDITQSHRYGTGEISDFAPVIHEDAIQHAQYEKPHLMGEFGIDWRKPDTDYDPEGKGINLHNGLWASVFSGNAGGGMIWWWDNYVHPLSQKPGIDLYGQFAALRKFTDGVHWSEGRWQIMKADAPRVSTGPEIFTDLTLPAGSGWGKHAETEFTLTPFGEQDRKTLTQFLYSPEKADLRTTPTFHVNFAKPGMFTVRVGSVSVLGVLRFLVDGKLAKTVRLDAQPPKDGSKPLYEKTELNKEYNIYQATFNRDFSIALPAGAHTVTLENTEGDWIRLESITLSGYRSSRYPDMNLYAMTNGKEAILWAQNAVSHWKNIFEKKPISNIEGAETVVHGLPEGKYSVEWWDTWQGKPVETKEAESKGGSLTLQIPAVARDMAARIVRK